MGDTREREIIDLIGEKPAGYSTNGRKESKSNSKESIDFNTFLGKIAIDSSTKGLNQLYQKYTNNAKIVDLSESLGGELWKNIRVFWLEIELPNSFEKDGNENENKNKERFSIKFVHVDPNLGDEEEREAIRNTLMNEFVYEKVVGYETVIGEIGESVVLVKQDKNESNKTDSSLKSYVFKEFISQKDNRSDDNSNNKKNGSPSFGSLIPKIILEKCEKMFLAFSSLDKDPNEKSNKLTRFLLVSDKCVGVFQDSVSKTNYFIHKDFIETITEISSQLKNKHIINLIEFARREAVKSAIAAIMSRNMSHNLGSHFISNTKNYFNALVERDPNNKKNYRGIKFALQYIQERMDFIATVTSTDVYPFGAVNAKAQIFDELTPDDFGKRHGQDSYNFLMDYLVLSEKVSKKSWEGDGAVLSAGEHKMFLQIGYCDGKGEPVYWDPTKQKDAKENKRRDDILGINFAIPGGILGRHAVFSIIENIIRNAAKHGQDKIKGDFIVKMLYRTDQHSLIVFDNKKDEDIKETVKKMEDKLKNLHFLTNEGVLEQENKGLKEMLVCAIWLQNKDVSQIMTDNDSNNKEDRLNALKEYLKVVAVDEDSNVFEPDEIGEGNKPMFLGYSFKLDQYERVHYLKENELNPEGFKSIKSDIVCYKEDCEVGGKKLSEIFPRFLVLSSQDEINRIGEPEILRQVVKKNCGSEAVNSEMVVSYTAKFNYKNNSDVVLYEKRNPNNASFLFKEHAGKSKWDKFSALFLTKGFENKYVDAISGGDFTYTLVQPSFVEDEYNLLKIKESVATRFVIIDERVFEHYKPLVTMTSAKGLEIVNGLERVKSNNSEKVLTEKMASYVFKTKRSLGDGIYDSHKQELEGFVNNPDALSIFLEKDLEQHFLDRRGISVFNLEAKDDGFYLYDLSLNKNGFLWKGQEDEFESEDVFFQTATTTFLSIHLGLIDKIREQLLEIKGNEGKGNAIDKEIVEALKKFFGAKFVSIHSGRGGFDVRDSLRQYTFQSFSAIENPLFNSKFILSQQFYNLNYYGCK